MKNPLSSSIKLSLAFLVFGICWTLISDRLTLLLTHNDLLLYNTVQHFKGILFMVLAALLIYYVSRKFNANIESANKLQEEALHRYKVLGMASKDAIWDYNMLTAECYTNRTLQEMFGYTADELQDNYHWWRNNLHPDDRERVIGLMDTKLAMGGTVWQDEYRFRCKDGSFKMIFDRGVIMRDKQGAVYRLIGAMQDITEQHKLQQELAHAKEVHKMELAQSILQAEEAERKKLSEELHDNINQLLGVVKLYVQHAQVNPGMRKELLDKCSDYITQTIEEIRHLSRSLLPPTLQEQGLLNSLYQLFADIRQVKEIDIDVETEDFEEAAIAPTRQLLIYRIIQEQLNNVLKHSGANQVTIRLRQSGTAIYLSVRDNGTGFDMQQNKPGLGLTNIRSRMELVNGRMHVQSAPGKGCDLRVEFTL
ncbi:MAG: PAS domain-containing protein [Candidatus Pseudobacter hemicellulosilyticus]|uniref:PAS domain-containing protein n=1 Tax=Candidatus Pseudobacter hemicellulosilyticus TaxID=3121375 RepID=A0AAJ5WX12_9BACT|nr:MAG: PAS domain-containing protein [Pseudobacter sp.]